MAGVLRFGVIVSGIGKTTNPLIKANIPVVVQACNISGRVLREVNKVEKPAPYPYRTKEYTLWNAFFDKTTKRFDENSKVNKLISFLL